MRKQGERGGRDQREDEPDVGDEAEQERHQAPQHGVRDAEHEQQDRVRDRRGGAEERPDLDVRDELGGEGVVAGDEVGRGRPQRPVVEPDRAEQHVDHQQDRHQHPGDRGRERGHDAARHAERGLRLDRRKRPGRDAGDGGPGVLRRRHPRFDLGRVVVQADPDRGNGADDGDAHDHQDQDEPTGRDQDRRPAGESPIEQPELRATRDDRRQRREREEPEQAAGEADPDGDDDGRRGDEQRPAELADGGRRGAVVHPGDATRFAGARTRVRRRATPPACRSAGSAPGRPPGARRARAGARPRRTSRRPA